MTAKSPRPTIRYGQLLSTVRVKQRHVSLNDVHAVSRSRSRTSRLRLIDVHRLLTPYVRTRLEEQLLAVVPLALFLALFLMVALQTRIEDGGPIALGMVAVMFGLVLFMDGVKYGLMPFAESIGFVLPTRANSLIVLTFAFMLGVIATFAEPAIGALGLAGDGVDARRAPYLHLLLTRYSTWLVWAVAIGVGLAVMLGMLRFFFGWRMKSLVIWTLLPSIAITIYAGLDPQLETVVALAWDCGAITTGPVTAPLVLALGLGVAAANGQQDNPFAGFGIVTLASLIPVIVVFVLAIGVIHHVPDPSLIESVSVAHVEAAWWEQSPVYELLGAVRTIGSLMLLLWLVQRFIIRDELKNGSLLVYGVVVAILGIGFFNFGLHVGLIPLGDQAGTTVPSAFSAIDGQSSLYPYIVGIAIIMVFATILGYGATMAEPALSAMGNTVQSLTNGVFTKRLLLQTVSFGVGLGVALGVAKIVFNWPIMPLLVITYTLALIATLLSSEEYVAMAWDCAAVTTGEVTVPLVLALGLGLGQAVGAAEGFGILALASAVPIISVLAAGLWARHRANRVAREQD